MGRIMAADLARRWRTTLSDTGFVPMPESELDRLLSKLVEEMVATLTAESFDAAAGARAGAELVRVNLTSPEVLTRSARVLTALLDATDRPDRVERFAALLGDLGRGYTEELLATRSRHQELLQTEIADARRAAELRFRVVFDNAAVAIAIGGTTGSLLDVNPALAAMVGRSADTLRGKPVLEFIHPDDRAEIQARIYRELVIVGAGTIRVEMRYLRPDHSYGWTSWSVTLVPEAPGRAAYLLGVGEDTTQQHALQAELHRQARHDPLTGLPNRRYLVETLTAVINEAGPGARIGLGFIDLDDFKVVNDTYGHGIGDRLLCTVATRLHAAVAGGGGMIARIGGDEFAVLIPPPCDRARIAVVAQALLTAASDPMRIGDLVLTSSASIGAVVTMVAGADADTLLDTADVGLYRAKADGGNRWVLHHHSGPAPGRAAGA